MRPLMNLPKKKEQEIINFYYKLSPEHKKYYLALLLKQLGHTSIDYLEKLFGCNREVIYDGFRVLREYQPNEFYDFTPRELKENGYNIYTNVEETKKIYNILKFHGQLGLGSNCENCKLIDKSITDGLFPKEIIMQCYKFGIHYDVMGEFYCLGEDQRFNYYSGHYSLFGKIVFDDTKGYTKSHPMVVDNDDIKIGFEDNCPLGTLNFPGQDNSILLNVMFKINRRFVESN